MITKRQGERQGMTDKNFKIENYYTIPEIEERYRVKGKTLRSYIYRDQVIPKDKYLQIGRSWLIERDWVDEKYKDKLREKKF